MLLLFEIVSLPEVIKVFGHLDDLYLLQRHCVVFVMRFFLKFMAVNINQCLAFL